MMHEQVRMWDVNRCGCVNRHEHVSRCGCVT